MNTTPEAPEALKAMREDFEAYYDGPTAPQPIASSFREIAWASWQAATLRVVQPQQEEWLAMFDLLLDDFGDKRAVDGMKNVGATGSALSRVARRELRSHLSMRPQAPTDDEQSCWLVEKREDGRTVAYLGHACGSYEWMPTADQATRFVRREDANGVAECMERDAVIVAEHIWQSVPKE